jgi:HAMP domain-containing protein
VLIENESQWLTEDLLALVARVQQIPEFTLENFYPRTLLLFKTSRLKEKVRRSSKGDWIGKPPAASLPSSYRIKYEDTRVVEIRSTSKIQLEVLDRLANSDDQQDMSKEDVVLVAKVIARALGGWKADHHDYDWASTMPLRVGRAPKRGAVALEREVRALRNEQDRFRRQARQEIEKIEKKIEKISKRKVAD